MASTYKVFKAGSNKLICEGNAHECASEMGISLTQFRSLRSSYMRDGARKYRIEIIPDEATRHKMYIAEQKKLHPDWECDQDRCLECKYDTCIITCNKIRKIKTDYYIHLKDGIIGREETPHCAVFHRVK